MTDNKFYGILAGIVVIFAAIRIVFLSQLMGTMLLQIPVLDSDWYYRWGASLALGYGHPDGPFWLGPGYPLALAGLFKATGSVAVELIPIVQMLLSIVTVIFLALTVRKLLGNATAFVTAGIAALYAPWVYYDGMILSAVWILFLNAVLLYLLIARTSLIDNEPRELNRELAVWGLAGIVCGLSAIARPSILIFTFLLIAAILMRRQLPKRYLKLALFAVMIFIVHLPILIRNYQVDGSAAFVTSSGGINFYIGNRDGASGKYDDAPWVESFEPALEAEGYRLEASARAARELTLNEASRFWAGEALRDIFQNKWGWLKLMARKLWLTLRTEEIANNFSFRGMLGFTPILNLLPLHWGFLLPFALAGLVLAWPMRKHCWLCALYVIGYLATNLIFFSSSEYRFPLLLALLPLAAYFMVAIWKRMEEKRWLTVAIAVGIYLIALLAANWPSRELYHMTRPLMDYRNLGSMAARRGMETESIGFYSRALTLDSDDRLARVGLADALWKLGSFDQAREEYERAGMRAPDDVSGGPLDSLLNELEQQVRAGDTLGALEHLQDEFPDSSDQPIDILIAKAQMFALNRRYEDAYTTMLRVHELDPSSPEWLYDAAEYILETGNAYLADSLYAASIQLYPAYAPARIERAYLALELGDIEMAKYQVEELRKIKIPDEQLRTLVDSLQAEIDRSGG